MISLLIGYEAVVRLLAPVPISFSDAIPIAIVGLVVNIISAGLLSGGDHHGHSHGHDHGHTVGGNSDRGHAEHDHDLEVQQIATLVGVLELSIFEEGIPAVFRIQPVPNLVQTNDLQVTTIRADGARQDFKFYRRSDFLESKTAIPEPHEFDVILSIPGGEYTTHFAEHDHGHDDHVVDKRDHNMRAAYVHVIADAVVSILAIAGLFLAKTFGWLWMDPVAGIVGALVIANWSYGLLRDTGKILMDISSDDVMATKVRKVVDLAGDKLVDLHVWRLGPGHFGAVVSVITNDPLRGPAYYHNALRRLNGLSHITAEVHAQHAA